MITCHNFSPNDSLLILVDYVPVFDGEITAVITVSSVIVFSMPNPDSSRFHTVKPAWYVACSDCCLCSGIHGHRLMCL